MKAIPFRTQARTIDHLGREQIADCPTAVSELWKNAWDAYAREVRLTVFAKPAPMAVVWDDGHGMSRDEFETRWLTIGTASKIDSGEVTLEADRNGLSERPKQGRKGIGRLSIGHLGPLVILISKRRGHPFVVAVVDWRVFENPFLRLEDVRVPVDEFERAEQLFERLPNLLDYHIQNVWPNDGNPRSERVIEAWSKYDGQGEDGQTPPSESVIYSATHGFEVESAHLRSWPVWNGEKDAGTAMLVLDVYPELRCWVQDGAPGEDGPNAEVKETLRRALMGFVDPYAPTEGDPHFRYAFSVSDLVSEREYVSSERGIDRARILGLEHVINGQFDKYGRFEGEVRAFGKEWIPWSFAPTTPIPQTSRGVVGGFSVLLGTFEQVAPNSTHSPDEHAILADLAKRFSGLYVYRDALRLQPYGRPENDFFRIEQRRTNQAGREFWSHRRMFGRVALTRDGNPNLKDKAGREGLIENTAMRRFRGLIEDFLKAAARRFFGYDAPERKSILAENNRRFKERAEAAARRSNRLDRKQFSRALRAKAPELAAALERTSELRGALVHATTVRDGDQVRLLGERLSAERSNLATLQLPARPRELGIYEADWRAYRDDYGELGASLDRASSIWREAMEELRPEPPEKTAMAHLGRHQKALHDQLRHWQAEAKRILTAEATRLDKRVADDRSKYYALAAPIAARAEDKEVLLSPVLDGLGRIRDEIEQELAEYYPNYVRALQRLARGIDLDGALRWSAEERIALESRLADISALAQIGIAFEIIGHEFSDIQRAVMSNLRRLPVAIQQSEAYRGAMDAYQALARRLKFFMPLQMAGRILIDRITGEDIARYLEGFFADAFARQRILLVISPAFRSLVVSDHRWRIYPVFINLLQNARYWVRQSDRPRLIRIDRIDDVVVVADSGPGIDPDDADAVFDLFFSRRQGGRGVGLYLARVNLAAAGHVVEVARHRHHQILPGANFSIHFKGIGHE